jgi:DNA-directed RNA polymerase specialized sigma24 family protein
MTADEATFARARAGDEDAFRELTEPHRRELQLHCYRIFGSMQDAEDLVQERILGVLNGAKDMGNPRMAFRSSLQWCLSKQTEPTTIEIERTGGRQ